MTASELEVVGAVVEALRPVIGELVRDEIDRVFSETHGAEEWLTVEEYAQRRRTTVAAVHQRLRRRQVPGAVKDGRRWLIPAAPVESALAPTSGPIARAA